MRKVLSNLSLATSIIATSSSGSIYVVPVDIDNYKRKTDQSFYDVYQNPDSAINPNKLLKPYTSGINTSQRMFEGNTIRSIKVSHVSGSPIPAGITADIAIRGVPYVIGTSANGSVFINGAYSDGQHVRRRGDDAVIKGNAPCASSSKYGCTRKQRYAEELYFDAPSSLVTVASVMQSRDYTCSKYGCNPTTPWKTSNILNMDRENVNLDAILRANDKSPKIKFK